MTPFPRLARIPRGWAAVLLPALLAACGGGLDPILGTPAIATGPTVTVTLPATSTPIVTGVDTGTLVSATFSQPMSAASVTTASFTLACPSGTPVDAGVAYDGNTRTATLTPTAALPANVICSATLSTALRNSQGVALSAAYVWSFRTAPAVAADTTRPTISVSVPTAGAIGVATNAAIGATFSEAMDAATIDGGSFSVVDTTAGSAVAGSVSYDAGSHSVGFHPAAPLASNHLFTASVTTAATDLAGNALAASYVWTFTTGAVTDTSAPTVVAIGPADGSSGLCLTRAATASFSEPMDAATVNAGSFGVTAAGVAVAGSVSYDVATRVASFVPQAAAGFAPSQTFVVTVRAGASGVKDLAGNALAADRVWTFATGTQPCLAAIDLGAAATYGAFGGGAGVTNQGIQTVVGGNLGTTAACTLVTGFHDAANVYTETPLNVGAVNGSISCGPPAPGTNASLAIATQARADAQAAYDQMAALPAGSDPGAGQLGGLVLPPAVYTAAGGTFAVTSGDLVLDAQGDTNAVWVFQSASALTVGLPATPRQVRLINGGKAKNVFWQVGSSARIEDGSVMVGTLIAPAGVTFSTAGQTIQTTLTGRAIGLTASVTLVNTTIVAP